MTSLHNEYPFICIRSVTGVVTTQCSVADLQLVDATIRDAHRMLPTWASQSAQQRSVVLRRAASLIRVCSIPVFSLL